MGMTRREFRGLAVLAALLAIIVAITAIAQCSRTHQTATSTAEPATPLPAANAVPGSLSDSTPTESNPAVVNFRPTLRSGAAQGDSGKFTAKRRANLKATKQKPGRKVKPMQPDRKSPLESPV